MIRPRSLEGKLNVAMRTGMLIGIWSTLLLKELSGGSLLQIGIGLTAITVLFLLRDFYRLERRRVTEKI